jgi:hypothetical protein
MKEQRNDYWEDAAETKGREWYSVCKFFPHQNAFKSNLTQWHWSKFVANRTPLSKITDLFATGQYNAWCLNNGDHETGKRGHLNWNSELIWKMRTELAFSWGLVEDEIPIIFDKLLQSIRTCFLNLQSHLRGK